MYNIIEPGCFFFSPFGLNLFTREMCDAIYETKFLTLSCLALLIVMGMSGDAWALGSGSDGGTIMGTAKTKHIMSLKG